MKILMIVTFVWGILLVMSTAVHANIVDSFDAGDSHMLYVEAGQADWSLESGLSTDNVIGGVRDATLWLGNRAMPRYGEGYTEAHFNWNHSGVLEVHHNAHPQSELSLTYGDLASDGPCLNADWSGLANMMFTFTSATLNPVDLEIILFSRNGVWSEAAGSIPGGAAQYAVSLSGCYTADVDGVYIKFSAQEWGTSFTLDRIEVIPEPTTISLLGLVGLAVLWRQARSV
ncbi:MAG: PEP-CTERM sorting domain-containing protein [Phycisphaerae bacterium]|nr:PEP-CTERM sorting domain-containing protein [Phycisphaerae bacterium]